jgi:hypothetical protein
LTEDEADIEDTAARGSAPVAIREDTGEGAGATRFSIGADTTRFSVGAAVDAVRAKAGNAGAGCGLGIVLGFGAGVECCAGGAVLG